MRYFSKSTKGFYDDEDFPLYKMGSGGCLLPADAVEIGEDYFQALSAAMASGKVLDWSGSLPVAADPPPPSKDDVVKRQILALESTQTARRMREAVLGIDGGWLKALNEQIAALRAKLSG